MTLFDFTNIRQAEGLYEELHSIKTKIEEKINLPAYTADKKPIVLSNQKIIRFCLFAGLADNTPRDWKAVEDTKLSSKGNHFHSTLFSFESLAPLYAALFKLRYQEHLVDWENSGIKSKIINHEILKGKDNLSKEGGIDDFLLNISQIRHAKTGVLPHLNLQIGTYEDDLEAHLDLNSKSIANTQILIAGTTGSGKSNLLAVLLSEIRQISIETSYPVNFLLFDYKGEFSDTANNAWLSNFEIDRTAILNPLEAPLPFSPFKDFVGKTQNEINLYSTELANALCAIENAKIGANMSNRLSEAIISAYHHTQAKPIHFELILHEYTALQPEKERAKDDSIKSVLKQLIRSNLFAKEDSIDLIKDSYIIKMDNFPKDGIIAKAIVYFVISKLNTIYEKLPKQFTTEEYVELRHFTIIDEAHYMLAFDNSPLRNLIAVGRNKGLSIIFATQSMDSYDSPHFDFYANAQYPLIMKQQTLNDKIIKDLFGVSGNEFQEVKQAIAGLGKGELIIKNPIAISLGMGKKYKKINVKHLI